MQQLLFHPLTVFVYSLLVFAAVFSLNQTVGQIRNSAETIHVLDSEINQIADQVNGLESQLTLAESEFTKEKILRDELLMQKPGEYVLQLPPLVASAPQPIQIERSTPLQEWQETLGL